MPVLYVVPTPIGNLEDMSFRALRILKEVALIAAEDTRTTRILLNHYEIQTPMTSYHEHNKLKKLDEIFDVLRTDDVALVSDAGTPGISDPGYELVQAAIAQDIQVVPLPGANALLPALVASGLPTDSFVFLGFLPRKAQARSNFLSGLQDEKRTMICYESPHRLTDALQALMDTLGNRRVCVAREVSKLYEEFFRGSASEVLQHFQQENPKGEVTLVIAGAPESQGKWDQAEVQSRLMSQLEAGHSLSQAAKNVAKQAGWRKGDVYDLGKELTNLD